MNEQTEPIPITTSPPEPEKTFRMLNFNLDELRRQKPSTRPEKKRQKLLLGLGNYLQRQQEQMTKVARKFGYHKPIRGVLNTLYRYEEAPDDPAFYPKPEWVGTVALVDEGSPVLYLQIPEADVPAEQAAVEYLRRFYDPIGRPLKPKRQPVFYEAETLYPIYHHEKITGNKSGFIFPPQEEISS